MGGGTHIFGPFFPNHESMYTITFLQVNTPDKILLTAKKKKFLPVNSVPEVYMLGAQIYEQISPWMVAQIITMWQFCPPPIICLWPTRFCTYLCDLPGDHMIITWKWYPSWNILRSLTVSNEAKLKWNHNLLCAQQNEMNWGPLSWDSVLSFEPWQLLKSNHIQGVWMISLQLI